MPLEEKLKNICHDEKNNIGKSKFWDKKSKFDISTN